VNHVAMVIPGLDRIGGAERQVILLAKGLRRRGWRVSVVVLSGAGGDAAVELSAAGVSFATLEMRKGPVDPRGWSGWIRFSRWVRQEAPDLIHAHLAHATWLGRGSRVAAPVRAFVDTLHSPATGTWGRRVGYRSSNWLADQVTAVSRAVGDAQRSAGVVGAGKMAVLANGVDIDTWNADAEVRNSMRRVLGFFEDEFLWLAAGRLESVKDYPTLLDAMALLPQRARLVIAGGGPLQSELLKMSARLGLECRIRFLGFEPDVKRWMQAADGFVLASRWEGLPMGLLEAGACALPAVATDVPGSREAIVNGTTGWLSAAGNAKALAAAMSSVMLARPEERTAMGERARKHVVENFSLQSVLDSWESLYAQLLERNPKPARWSRGRRPGGAC
jgi:glycosyltransferase involved in cell wall biosynthesis